MRYAALCVSGLQGVAWRELEQELESPRLLAEEEGLLVFESATPPGRLRSVPYLNNTYLLLAPPLEAASVDEAVCALLDSLAWQQPLARARTAGERSYRLMLSDASRLVAGERQELGRLRAAVESASGLRHTPRGGDVELWILRRRSGLTLFVKRLSRRRRGEAELERGELRPELAHLLCLLSEPSPSDVFLDPFAGSGAIPFARARQPYDLLFALDADEGNVRAIKARAKDPAFLRPRKGSPFIARVADARRLDRFDDGFVHKVVTDPPWGHFDTGLSDPATFYRAVLAELCRVTRSGGLLVLLLGDRELAEELSAEHADLLQAVESYDLLVAGRKAVVRKWRRIPPRA